MSELARALACIAAAVALSRWSPAIAAGAPSPAPGSAASTSPSSTGCAVSFRPNGPPSLLNGVIWSETVVASVRFADGHTEQAVFPYPWVYQDGERNDPWSDTNLRRRDFDVRVIMPPVGSDRTTFPPLVRYILDRTTPGGYTTLTGCPRRPAGSPSPSPSPLP